MKMLIKLLLIASLGTASLAASNTYMTPTDRLAFGHVLAEDVTFGELVVRDGALAVSETTLTAGTALGPAEIARLSSEKLVSTDATLPAITTADLEGADQVTLPDDIPYQPIETVTVYTELGADEGAAEAVAVADLTAGQVLGMAAQTVRDVDGLDGDRAARVVSTYFPAGTVITRKTQRTLNDADVEEVRVTDFRFEQWAWKWWFVIGCVGMFASAMLTRMTAPKGGVAERAGYTYETTAGLIREIASELEAIRARADAAMSDRERCRTIADGLDDLKAGALFSAVEGLSALKTRDGYGHYADVVDGFAYGERQTYRAWSAAVDNNTHEAMLCIRAAHDAMADAATKLHA